MSPKHTEGRPDILLIVSDQHQAAITGCYGDPIVQTPHLDGLASEGVRFQNAYCSSPVCGPSRQSFLTGLYPHQISCWTNNSALPSDIPTYAHALTMAGYEVVLDGRAHFRGPDQRHGFEKRLVGDINSSLWGKTADRWVRVGETGYEVDSSAFERPSITVFSGPGGGQFQDYDAAVLDAGVDFIKTQRR